MEFIPVAISVIALLFSWKSFVVSKKALKISQKDHDEKYKDITPYLIRSVKYASKETSDKLVSFAVSYTNRASIPNTFSKLALEVTYFDEEGELHKVILIPEEIKENFWTEIKQLSIPLNISAKTTISGWVGFKLPKALKQNKRIDKYSLVATTADDKKVIVESFLIKEIENEDTSS